MFNFHSGASNQKCDTLVRKVAERTAAEILSQLGTTLAGLSEAELRGYVRARAWPLVCDDLQQIVTGDPTLGSRQDLAGRVLEQTVHIVVRACTVSPIVSVPMPHIGRRAA
jgi:hypothetical protein